MSWRAAIPLVASGYFYAFATLFLPLNASGAQGISQQLPGERNEKTRVRSIPIQHGAANAPPLPAAPSVVIERFGPEHGYSVGVDNVVLLCVVRNSGPTALPGNTLRLRCYPISGLDYTVGSLLPVLPALAPGQAVAYRWRLAPTDAHATLVAGVVLENQGLATAASLPVSPASPPTPAPAFSPQLAFTVVSRLAHAPTFGEVPLFKDPLAHAGERDGSGLLLNSHVGVRVLIGERREPLLILAAREGANWHGIASSLPLLRACLSEDGQLPWLQSFRCQQMRAHEDRDSATLTLTGSIGTACRADLTLESRPETCVLIGHLRLTALRPLRLAGLQLPALMTSADVRALPPSRSDGTPLLLPDAPSPLPEEARLAVAHVGATTFGVAWPTDPPLPGWKWNRLPMADGVYTLNLGVQASGSVRGDLIQAGTSIECTFRLFAFAPSDTVRDATRFQMP